MYGSSAIVFSHLASLLQYWSRIRSMSVVYEECIEIFWSYIHSQLCDSVIVTKLENGVSIGKEELEKRLSIQYEVIKALKNPVDYRQKKPTHVCFYSIVMSF